MTNRSTKIRRKKLYRYHCERRYKRHKRGHYSNKHWRRRNACVISPMKRNPISKATILGAEFESLVLQIIDAIFSAEENKNLKKFFKEKPSKTEMDAYMKIHAKESVRIIHSGFKKAQSLIIDGLLQIQAEKKVTKKLLKEARQQKANNKNLLVAQVHVLDYKETVLKHLADTIFWQLIEGKLYIARRFHKFVPGNKTLEETNYKSVLLVADEINSNPDNFVLLTDITNYIQIGDLIGVVDGKRRIIEVKDGEKNNEIVDDLDDVYNSKLSVYDFFEKYGERPKDIEQIRRILKQEEAVEDEINIIRTDMGHDPVTDRNIKILTPKEDTPYFYEELRDLEKQLSQRKFWAYTVIEGCLHIGLYKNKWKIFGKLLLENIAKDQHIEHKVIVDARSSMKTMDCPLLFMPFSKQLIIDILLGKVLMYLMLDIDKFMKLFEFYGTRCSWTSRKEATKIKEGTKNLNIYLDNNRAIKMKNANGVEAIMAMGTITKIIFNHIKPTYIAYASNYYT